MGEFCLATQVINQPSFVHLKADVTSQKNATTRVCFIKVLFLLLETLVKTSQEFSQVISSSQVIFFQVIDETLSPTWDQLLLFSSVLVYGTRFCFLF